MLFRRRQASLISARSVDLPRWLVIGCALAAAGCTRQYLVSDVGPQAYYQTGFPIRDTSNDLERIARSVRRIGITSTYTTYRFAREDSITDADARAPATLAQARERYTFDHSKAGTATIIEASAIGLTLLTNDHVTRTPDTLIVHFGDRPDGRPVARRAGFVESISIRSNQRNVVLGLPEALPFTVSARDSASDLALIRVNLLGADQRPSIHVLRATMGDAARLSWGSFVYVLGYPKGYRMVTRGIVSDPGYAPDDAFLLDGLFNRGISGGLILAVRGDTGVLEWIGIASTAAAQTEFKLVPEVRDLDEEGLLVPYEGRFYLEQASRIEYGITFPVSSTAIRRFLSTARVNIPARE